MPDWNVVVYGIWPTDEGAVPDIPHVLAQWFIIDQAEDSALREAQAEIQDMGNRVADWTMKEIDRND